MQMNLCSITIIKYKPPRDQQAMMSKLNFLNQAFSTETICKKWTVDITYIPQKKRLVLLIFEYGFKYKRIY